MGVPAAVQAMAVRVRARARVSRCDGPGGQAHGGSKSLLER
jgi:hypothetical protein